jgi:septal ring factor EnvC (AmiA/AmiB activator)
MSKSEKERKWISPEDGSAEDQRNPLKPLIPLADLAKIIGALLGALLVLAVLADTVLVHDRGQSETSSMSQLIEKQNKTTDDLTTKIDKFETTTGTLSTQQTSIQASQLRIEKAEKDIKKRLDALSESNSSGSTSTSKSHQSGH